LNVKQETGEIGFCDFVGGGVHVEFGAVEAGRVTLSKDESVVSHLEIYRSLDALDKGLAACLSSISAPSENFQDSRLDLAAWEIARDAPEELIGKAKPALAIALGGVLHFICGRDHRGFVLFMKLHPEPGSFIGSKHSVTLTTFP
jgi:hypothetical protein